MIAAISALRRKRRSAILRWRVAMGQERPFCTAEKQRAFLRSATAVILCAAGRRSPNHANSWSSALASFRSSVSKPSVNQP